MAPSWVKAVPEFLLSRFPFINAISLILLLAERAENEKEPPMPAKLIYTHVAVFLVGGFLMSGRSRRKEMALVYAGQMMYFAYNMYSNQMLRYTQWQRIRMAVRHFGCAGVFILYSFIFDEQRPRPPTMRKVGETMIGIYLLGLVYVLNNSTEDKRAFTSHIIGGDWSRYFFTLVIAGGAICFFAGYFIRDISISTAVALTVFTIFVDCDVPYWVDMKGMHFWNQIRIILDDVCVMLGFLMFVVKFCNRVKVKSE